MMFNPFKRNKPETPQAPMTLAELADQYIGAKLQHSTSRNVRGHFSAVTRFSEHLKREPVLADLSEPTIRTFLNSRLAMGLKETSVATEQNRLYALWRFAFDHSYIDEAPGKKPIPCKGRRKRVTPPDPQDYGANYEALDFF